MRGRGGRSRACAAAVVLLALAPGCWWQAGAGPERRGSAGESAVTVGTVADLEVAWTASAGTSAAEAVVDRGTAYVAGPGRVTAFALATGQERWSVDAGVGWVPALVDGRLHLAGDCFLVSLDPATGASVSADHAPTDRGPGNRPGCLDGDALGVGGRVVVPWETGFSVGHASPACNRGHTFVLSGPGLAGYDAGTAGPPGSAGEPAAEVFGRDDMVSRCLAPGVPDLGHVPAGPLSADDEFLLVPQGRRLRAFARDCAVAQCPVAWEVDLGATIVGPAVVLADGDLAVPTADAGVVVLDGDTHAVAWTGALPSPLEQPLAASGGTILAATTDGAVSALPAGGCGGATCAPTWRARLPAAASARPSIAGGVAYVGGADGTLTALAAAGCGAATCAPLWSAAVPGEVAGAPVVSDGTVLVGSSEGTVTAFAL